MTDNAEIQASGKDLGGIFAEDISALRTENSAGLRRIGVLTSGGDAPGMNAAVRAVVRTAAFNGLEVVGIRRGFNGLHDGEMGLLGPRDVANIIQRGGTMLLTARSEAWRTLEGRVVGAEYLREWEVDGLVVIGGEGLFTGRNCSSRNMACACWAFPAPLTTTFTAPITPSATIRRCRPLWTL